MANITMKIKATKNQMTTLEALLQGLKIDYDIISDDVKTTTSQPKAEKTTKSSSKTSDDEVFPSALYKSTAKELGCLSKKGTCYKQFRDIVYDVIGWDLESNSPCKPKLTKAAGKKAVQAKFKELGWKVKK